MKNIFKVKERLERKLFNLELKENRDEVDERELRSLNDKLSVINEILEGEQ